VQPDHGERGEAEGDRADGRGQLRIAATPAEQKRERQRGEHLHRRLGGHRVAEGQRQREEAHGRQRGALRIREQRIAGGRERVPERRLERLPALADLMRPRRDLVDEIVHPDVRGTGEMIVADRVGPRLQRGQKIDGDVDVRPAHRREQEEEHQRVKQHRHADGQLDLRAARDADRHGIDRADVEPGRIEHVSRAPSRNTPSRSPRASPRRCA
jgi:hypothetical protein